VVKCESNLDVQIPDHHILWEMISCAVKMATGQIRHKLQNPWKDYPTILSFAITGKHFFGSRFVNLMRGISGTNGYSSEFFDFDAHHNFPFPSLETVSRHLPLPLFSGGPDLEQIRHLLEIAGGIASENQTRMVVETPNSVLYLGTLARDGTPIKPSLRKHKHMIVGMESVLSWMDLEEFKEKDPTPDLYVTCSDEVWFHTLDGLVRGDVGVFYKAGQTTTLRLKLELEEMLDGMSSCASCLQEGQVMSTFSYELHNLLLACEALLTMIMFSCAGLDALPAFLLNWCVPPAFKMDILNGILGDEHVSIV
jgi:hypothetical protein